MSGLIIIPYFRSLYIIKSPVFALVITHARSNYSMTHEPYCRIQKIHIRCNLNEILYSPKMTILLWPRILQGAVLISCSQQHNEQLMVQILMTLLGHMLWSRYINPRKAAFILSSLWITAGGHAFSCYFFFVFAFCHYFTSFIYYTLADNNGQNVK